jgi:aspartyl-tRNA(Asn)/glutamyl-tRNA(Gln) amidotransferase subunit A
MSVRARIQREIAALFGDCDLILCPTCPTPAFRLGQKVDNPLEMYLSDLYTTFVNLARIPSLSVPAGATRAGLPVGGQVAGALFSEAKFLRVAEAWEQEHPGCGVPLK